MLFGNHLKEEAQIQPEIDLSRFSVGGQHPSIVCSLGAVPKGQDKMRVIHDLSCLDGGYRFLLVHPAISCS